MNRVFLLRAAFAGSLLLLIFAPTAWGSTTGSIRGQVGDPEGNPIPGVAVTIRSSALIGGTREGFTSELGVFRFPSVPIGTYSVQVSLEGFETIRIDNVEVRLDRTANVPVTMKIVSTQSLTIIGESPILDISRPGITTSFKNEIKDELPIRRHFTNLISLAPGVSPRNPEEEDPILGAFGSNVQSNSYNIDGVNFTSVKTGWNWSSQVGVDDIEEVQISGVGTSAEYGNHSGAVFNMVTKRGGNDFHGSANYYFQTDPLTDVNVSLPDSPFTFHRNYFRNVAAQLGGPIRKDKIWFFASGEYWDDSSTQPGNDPDFAPNFAETRFHFKVSAAFGKNHQFSAFQSLQMLDYAQNTSPFVAPSAQSEFLSTNPAWGASLTSTLNPNLLLELNYAGWWADGLGQSQTGSHEDPFVDLTPAGGGPPTFSGGILYPFDLVNGRHQVRGKLTYYAANFLKDQHEFKFGVQYSNGHTQMNAFAIGPSGTYTYSIYGNLYRAYQVPFQYGGESNYLGLFIDDIITVGNSVTLNLGVRYDRARGAIPDYERLMIGTPSFTPAGNFQTSGEVIPGFENLIRWNLISPRLGFTFQPRSDGRSIFTGSFGVYYDQNVIGNWEFPPPQIPPLRVFAQDPKTGLFDQLRRETTYSEISLNTDLRPPKTLQYSIGYQQEVSQKSAFGIQYVFKDTKDLIGWEILGGSWEPFPFIDPFTGTQYTLLSQVSPAVLRKGNDPGDFPGSEGLRYFQKYHAVVLTYSKRFSNDWGLNASYTWSRSTGLSPRMLVHNTQGLTFFGATDGSDPNNFINAEGRLQGDRPHMFRLQAVFLDLPWDWQASTSVDFSSGIPHSRQILVDGLGQGRSVVIMEPTGSYRLSTFQSIDVSIGKRFAISQKAFLRFEAWIFNLLNADSELELGALTLQSPQEDFVPINWIKPRRLQIRVGFQF